MRILHLAPFCGPAFVGGLQRYVRELLRLQRERGLAATLLTTGSRAEEAGECVRARSYGVVLRTPVAPGLIAEARRLARGADIVHLHGPNPAFEAAAWAALAARPRPRLVVTLHNGYPHVGAAGRPALAAAAGMLARLLRLADAVIVPHRGFPAALPAAVRRALEGGRTHVVPPGCDHRVFRPPDRPAEEGGGEAAFAARLRPEKGLGVLLAAMERLDGVRLLVLAPERGSERAVRAARAEAERRLGGRVRFVLDPTDETLAREFGRAGLVVVPSTGLESWNLVLLEAAACGAACLRSDLPGLSWATFAPAVAGRDARTWAAAIRSALDDREALGRAARAAALEYSWERTARETLAVYERALAG